MKYRLKRDLPFAKAGEEIKFLPSRLEGQNITYEVNPENGVRIWVADINRLINEGWIEEVKPREFILAIKEDTRELLYNSDYTNTDYYYKTYWRGELNKLPERIKLIKVREVIE